MSSGFSGHKTVLLSIFATCNNVSFVKVFEHTLKTWSEKQKNDPSLSMSLNKEEFTALQHILDDSITLIKRIKTASLKNGDIEQDLYGYATQASSNLDEICVNGRIIEKSLRQQVCQVDAYGIWQVFFTARVFEGF
jgi:hypothetical protein